MSDLEERLRRRLTTATMADSSLMQETAERIRELEAEVSVERHNLAISEYQLTEAQAEGERCASRIRELEALVDLLEAEGARLRESCTHWNDIYDNSCLEVARLRKALEQTIDDGLAAIRELEAKNQHLVTQLDRLMADRRHLVADLEHQKGVSALLRSRAEAHETIGLAAEADVDLLGEALLPFTNDEKLSVEHFQAARAARAAVFDDKDQSTEAD